jgi:ketol-acid reductoisomerase
MAVRIYRDGDADLDRIRRRRIAFIGYGNQGSAQAQNIRESGVRQIRVGNREDEYAAQAASDGFAVTSPADAAVWGEVVFLLIPDEDQPGVFVEEIAGGLAPGNCLVVGSGYNLAFELLQVPAQIDVVMVAPRMVGAGVRRRYLRKQPFPCFISVEQDASGEALGLALAIARGIGATRGGAIASSALEEAAIDLMAEQAIWPTIVTAFCAAYEALSRAGFSDEAIVCDMYLSKEPAEIFEYAAEKGLFDQLPIHSTTSQFGQMRGMLAEERWLSERFDRILREDILSGRFAEEWGAMRAAGADELERLRERIQQLPLARADRRVRRRVGDIG